MKLIIFLIALLVPVGLFFGLNLSSEEGQFVLFQVRIPELITALLAGFSLGIAGQLMQILFRNPMAGPYVLGIQGSAGLFVGLGMLFFPTYSYGYGLTAWAFVGCLMMFLLLTPFTFFSHSGVFLLVIGLLLSHLTGSLTSLLTAQSDPEAIRRLTLWSQGDFGRGSNELLLIWLLAIVVVFVLIIIFRHSLTLYTLGNHQMSVLGANPKGTQVLLVATSSILTALVVAICGPISFVGLISPHIYLLLDKHYELKRLFLGAGLVGGLLTVFAHVFIVISPFAYITLNSLFGLIGIPVIFYLFYQDFKGGRLASN